MRKKLSIFPLNKISNHKTQFPSFVAYAVNYYNIHILKFFTVSWLFTFSTSKRRKKKARESRNCNSKSEIVVHQRKYWRIEWIRSKYINSQYVYVCIGRKCVAAFQSIFICIVILGSDKYVDLKSIPESRNKSWRIKFTANRMEFASFLLLFRK